LLDCIRCLQLVRKTTVRVSVVSNEGRHLRGRPLELPEGDVAAFMEQVSGQARAAVPRITRPEWILTREKIDTRCVLTML